MHEPLVSIIIPIYNVESYISECINSVISQTYKNLEIILVDDCSKDNSLQLGVNTIKNCHNKIKYKVISHQKNSGLSSARNSGLDNADGEYVMFLDSDDFISKNTIEKLIKPLMEHDNIAIVSAPCFLSYNDGKIGIFKDIWDIKKSRIISYEHFCSATLKHECNHSACAKLYRVDLFDNLRFRIGRKNEDTLFMYDLSSIIENKQISMLEIPDALYYYRFNPNSITQGGEYPFIKDVVDNLIILREECDNSSSLPTIESLYYRELVSFISILLSLKGIRGRQLRDEYLDTYLAKLKNENLHSIYVSSSFRTTLKAIVFSYSIVLSKLLYKLLGLFR